MKGESAKSKKRVLVTGAGRGIGRAIALALVQEGYLVSGCARTRSELEETAALSQNQIRTAQIDVSQPGQVEQWIAKETSSANDPWGLVTAAGIHGAIGPFLDTQWEEWKSATEVNLYGTAIAVQSFARELVRRKTPGRIVLLSGGGATRAIENMTAYCASKSAVVRFGETMAEELRPFGISVNSIAPGAVNTALTQTIVQAGPEKSGKALYESALKQTRGPGVPVDKAASLVSYLMSEVSAPVSGRLIAAVWDDWAHLHENKTILESSDYYKLRRHIPPDEAVK
ncbi:MAG: SDR family oxidoreductase [Deltaproteobacteria bacterium]|nr:SDR family oxidoreductase [Deltaproteobacteria bacterium]